MPKRELAHIVRETLKKLSVLADGVVVERPAEEGRGDYATNVALVYAKKLNKNPKEFALEIKKEIENCGNDIIEKMEIAGPGFINFFLKDALFTKNIATVLNERERYGKSARLKGKKIMVEYTQPNPFKPFHIGHLMSNAIGESISRIVEANGAQVIRVNYQGDMGLHVAKAIWAIQKKGYDPKSITELGEAYVYGSSMYEEDEDAKREIVAINKSVYAENEESINAIYNIGRKTSLDHFEELYKKLGTAFDEYFFESQTWRPGKELVEKNIGPVFEKSNNAVIFPGEKYGLHSRVFITGEGIPTYETKDIGLAQTKLDRHSPDVSITITAVEQKEYFNVVFKAFEMINKKSKGVFLHISHGMMQFASGKMSSRKGNIITGESLILEAEKMAEDKMRGEDIENKSELATQIGVAAIKYPILKQSIGKNITFDLETALSFEGDSGPYLQYTYARIRSILRKADHAPSLQVSETPAQLERLLQKFPEVVEMAHDEYAPSRITSYLIEVSQEFNSYYGKYKIAESPYRLALAEATATIIGNGLYLLGISAPERM